jgi:hypothetical protein
MPGWYVTANDIKEWTATKKREAEETLPQLVKKLVYASSKPKSIEFPSGDSVVIGGWDGILEIEEGKHFIPTGKSGWEFGTDSKVNQKADDDYKKRTEKPEPLILEESTFVFVTSRLWTKRDSWAHEKKSEGKWKDVIGINAETLQSWLEHCPAVHRWFANLIGKRTSYLWDIEQAWSTLSNVTEHALIPDLFLNARDEEKTNLLNGLKGGASVLRVKCQSKKESYGFILTVLMQEDRYTSRTLIVKNQAAWDWVMDFNQPLILIPENFTPNGIGGAIAKGHHVIMAIDNLDSAQSTIELNRMPRQNRIEAIKSIGLPDGKAEQVYRETKGYLEPILRHKMLSPRDISTPEWIEKVNSDILFSVLFATEWNTNNDKDKEVMASLSGLGYGEFEKNVIELSKQPDPPVRLVGNIWQVISKMDMWLRIAHRLARPHLDILGKISKDVLKDSDPSFDLAPEERFMASIKGAVPLYSTNIKSGIADSLALLSAHGDDYVDHVGSEKTSDLVRWWTRQIFEGNIEAKAWYSLGGCLQTISEAVPAEFLSALEESMNGSDPDIKGLFLAEGSGVFGGCPHSHLLWSLELVSWNTQYLARVSTCLARLSEIDPGGTYSNRPFESLKNIFLGWINNTRATHRERLQIIENVLVSQFPDIAWMLMISLLHGNTQMTSGVHKPKYRELAEGVDRKVSQRDYLEYNEKMVEILLREADKNIGKRLPDLIDNFGSYNEKQQESFLTKLTDLDANSLGHDDREQIVRKIQEILSHHREFPDAEWAWSEELLEKLENVYHHFELDDIIQKNSFLFDDNWPKLIKPTKRKEISYEERIKIIESNQTEVLEEIFDTMGSEGISELALSCKYPGTIGFALFQSKLSEQVIPNVLGWLGFEGPLNLLAKSYISAKSHKDWDWAKRILDENQEWDNDKKTSLLWSLPVTSKTFDLVENQPIDIQHKYWSEFNRYFLPTNEKNKVPYVAVKLLENNRPLAAVDAVAQILWGKNETGELESSLVADILIKIATDPSDIDRVSIQNVQHDILKAIEFIQTRADLPPGIIAQIEWLYLKMFRFSEFTPHYLFERIAKEPSFFVQLVAWKYRRQVGKDPKEDLSEELKRQRAETAWELLDTVSVLPGSEGASINTDELNAWVDLSRKMLDEIGRLKIGDDQIGTYLSRCPEGSDGIWPHEAVRNVIERVRSAELDSGIQIGRFNSRGITSRAPFEGGQQERKLTEIYEENAKKIEFIQPRTACILRDLARSYGRDAKRIDDDVELFD